MHGQGTFNRGNGETFDGQFKRGLYHGTGILRRVNGDWYQGQFKRGAMHGQGTMKPAEGGVYNGAFYNGQYHGQGTYKWPNNGGVYTGTWRKGKRWGYGRRIFAAGAEYEGEFALGSMHGRGTYKNTRGDQYTGEFVADRYHGFGIMVYGNGDRYEGQWQLGVFCGVGRYTYQNGGYYDGEYWALTRGGIKARLEPDSLEPFQVRAQTKSVFGYTDEKRNEAWQRQHTKSGVKIQLSKELRKRLHDMRRSVGRVLVGSAHDNPEQPGIVRPLCDGKRHGKGVRVWADGSRYEGDWYQDKMHGFGVLVRSGPKGERYEGQWIHGIRQGRGIASWGHSLGGRYTNPLGHIVDGGLGRSVYDGQWILGNFHGLGKLINPDGRDYEGEFLRGQRHGIGTQILLSHENIEFIKKAGRHDSLTAVWKYEGSWVHNKRQGVGLAYQLNGDKLHGTFIQGRLHGVVKVMTKSGHVHFKLYDLGSEVRALTPEEAKAHAADDHEARAAQEIQSRRKRLQDARAGHVSGNLPESKSADHSISE